MFNAGQSIGSCMGDFTVVKNLRMTCFKDILSSVDSFIKVPKFIHKKSWRIVFSALGIAFILMGIAGFFVFQHVFPIILKENLALGEGKELFQKWKKAPIAVTFKAYLFNITNPDEVLQGAKPRMAQTGPYVFDQYRSKDVLSWNNEYYTVTYRDKKVYYFRPDLSEDLDAKIYTINMPLQGIVMFLKKLSPLYLSIVAPLAEQVLAKYNESFYSYKTPRELLFDGYKVDLIQDLTDLASPFVKVPEILPGNMFGYLVGKNNSGDGVFEVFTGADDISKYSQIVKWNNMSRVPYWNDQFCNMMNGTDGAQFPPPVTKKDVLYAYSPDLCRSVYLEYREETKVHDVPALRFSTPDRLFANAYDNPDNMCFCTAPEYCHLSGVMDLSPCRNGVRLLLSGPHFYLSHEFIRDSVEGLNPDKDIHDVYVDVEPTTGFVLRAARKLQINVLVEKFEAMEETKNLAQSVIPLVWVMEGAEITEQMSDEFNSKMRTPIAIVKSVLTACIVLGILWIATAVFVTIYILMKEQKTAKATIKSKYKAVPQKPDDILKPNEKNSVNA